MFWNKHRPKIDPTGAKNGAKLSTPKDRGEGGGASQVIIMSFATFKIMLRLLLTLVCDDILPSK